MPSLGLTVSEVALTASTLPRTTRCTLGRTGFSTLQLVRFAITAAFAPVPLPIVPAVRPPVFENEPGEAPEEHAVTMPGAAAQPAVELAVDVDRR